MPVKYHHFRQASNTAHSELGVEPVWGVDAVVDKDDNPEGTVLADMIGRLEGLFPAPRCVMITRVSTRPREIAAPC